MKATSYILSSGKIVTAYIPEQANYKKIAALYDLCNDLFTGPEYFYTKEQVQAMKQDPTNIFLKGD